VFFRTYGCFGNHLVFFDFCSGDYLVRPAFPRSDLLCFFPPPRALTAFWFFHRATPLVFFGSSILLWPLLFFSPFTGVETCSPQSWPMHFFVFPRGVRWLSPPAAVRTGVHFSIFRPASFCPPNLATSPGQRGPGSLENVLTCEGVFAL